VQIYGSQRESKNLIRVGQNHTFIGIYGCIYGNFGRKSPYIRSYSVLANPKHDGSFIMALFIWSRGGLWRQEHWKQRLVNVCRFGRVRIKMVSYARTSIKTGGGGWEGKDLSFPWWMCGVVFTACAVFLFFQRPIGAALGLRVRLSGSWKMFGETGGHRNRVHIAARCSLIWEKCLCSRCFLALRWTGAILSGFCFSGEMYLINTCEGNV
jgi:hypothetical protein